MNATVSRVNRVTAVNIKEDWEVKRERRLDQAAKVLIDELWPIKDKLERACLLLCDITDEYFRKFSREDEKDKFGIWCEFSRNATYADIINDYVFQAKKALAELEERADRAREVKADGEKTNSGSEEH